ncbi:Uncharacterised protein [Bordetella pertussis]|nr:Uncharacterised protein [Bordetella pertussis]CFW47532.1 Uncharacterised protein [Bordetella pertussis]
MPAKQPAKASSESATPAASNPSGSNRNTSKPAVPSAPANTIHGRRTPDQSTHLATSGPR